MVLNYNSLENHNTIMLVVLYTFVYVSVTNKTWLFKP